MAMDRLRRLPGFLLAIALAAVDLLFATTGITRSIAADRLPPRG